MSSRKFLIGLIILTANMLMLLIFEFGSLRIDKPMDISFPVSENVDHLLLFAGYPDCKTICPRRLSELNSAYRKDISGTPSSKLAILFVDLEPGENQLRVDEIARSYHQDFLGWRPEKNQRDQLIRALGIFYAPAMGAIERPARHSSAVYYLQRNDGSWRLKKIIRNPLKESTRLIDISETL